MSSFIAPQATTVAAFRVAGIAVRTTIAAEADPASARIGPLWGPRFFSESWETKLPRPAPMAGVWRLQRLRLRPAWRLRT